MARQVGRIVGAVVKESNFIKLCLACHELAQGNTGQLFLPEGTVGKLPTSCSTTKLCNNTQRNL